MRFLRPVLVLSGAVFARPHGKIKARGRARCD
jgi:hypothetical protein